jgi:3-hydroxyisobutyrate dehydrogenase-like beta-hydroxyacid dehydrogenase
LLGVEGVSNLAERAEMAAIRASARIGWIGMGKMGLPICKRLRGAGFQIEALCRNDANASVATTNGFEVARTISETAEGADVVASAISDDKALFDIVLAEGGLKDRLSREQVYIDMSTVSPEMSEVDPISRTTGAWI